MGQKKSGQKASKKYKQNKDLQMSHCNLPKVEKRPLPDNLHPMRESLIRIVEKKWANGTVLHYYFFDKDSDGPNGRWVGPQAQQDVVRNAFAAWKELGIGLEFREVSIREEAEIRIGFDQGDGSWSYVGRDIIDLAGDPNERTMNFGWDLTTNYGWDTALHEIGHTLGFPHAHQNPFSGIDWDEDAVYRYFSGAPNYWDRQTIDWNILRKLSPQEVEGSPWDPDSIMQYAFPAGVIVSPSEYRNGLNPQPGLSAIDKDQVRLFYPPIESDDYQALIAYQSQRIDIAAGEQVDFILRPEYSREYVIQTFGWADTVMVLFEKVDDEPRYLSGDDDSGNERNAKITCRLSRGREYILRVRLYYSFISGDCAVMLY